MNKFVVASIAALAIAPFAMAGGSWDETTDGGGDAGETPGTVQVVNGVGGLITITGSLSSGADADAFLIQVKDASNLYIEQIQINFDPQLFLFNPDGTGVVHNDDYPGLPDFSSAIDNAAWVDGAMSNGNFILAITSFNNDPEDAGGTTIFGFSEYSQGNQQRMPDTNTPWDHFQADGGGGGDYTITLRGVSYVPAPGAFALLGVAGLLARRRRRA